MDKCRLCLRLRCKKLQSIFDTNGVITYAEMVAAIANVKIYEGDSYPNKICYICCRKLIEAYDFKLMIERSDVAQQESFNLKRINFNTINDIKLSIELIPNDCKGSIPLHFPENLIDNHENCFHYNDTLIKRVPVDEKKPLSVAEFLKSFKDEPVEDDDDYDYGYELPVDYESDPDFEVVPKAKKNIKMKKRKITSQMSKQAQKPTKRFKHSLLTKNTKMKPIKPVHYNDLRLVPYNYSDPSIVKPKKKYKQYEKREEICPYCGKMSKTLKQHMLNHVGERKYKCDICGAAFCHLPSLKAHERNTHSSRDIHCDLCVATFTSKEALKSHMKTHTGEKSHICEICSKGFRSRHHLKRHKQAIHNIGAQKINCELCTMSFNTKASLKHHMRIHTGERPYKCEICAQPYSYKHDFNRHCLKKHGVCFKRRSVYVMNEEVLKQERVLMRDLMLRVNGFIKDDKPVNPFEGPQAAMAFEQAVKAIETGKIPIDFNTSS